MRRSHYVIIIFASIVLALQKYPSVIWSHGDSPFADMRRLIVGSIVWLVLIMIALLVAFLCGIIQPTSAYSDVPLPGPESDSP
jgi:hypothetical protein